MKKILALVLVCALCMSVAVCVSGCGSSSEKKDSDTIVMATNAAFPPYEFKGDDGKIQGIDAEIAKAVADKLGKKLEIKDVDFGAIIGGVQSGKYDMGLAGMTVTDERKQSVNFSDTYAKGVQSVIVKADSKYTSYEDFYTGEDDKKAVKEGIKIGVQQDTTGDIYSSDTVENYGFGEDNVTRYKTGADAVEALKSGKVTAVIIDNEPAKSFVASNDGLKILDGAYVEEEYAACFSKDNKTLLKDFNKALKELKADGTIDGIIAKYIPAE